MSVVEGIYSKANRANYKREGGKETTTVTLKLVMEQKHKKPQKVIGGNKPGHLE